MSVILLYFVTNEKKYFIRICCSFIAIADYLNMKLQLTVIFFVFVKKYDILCNINFDNIYYVRSLIEYINPLINWNKLYILDYNKVPTLSYSAIILKVN